MKSFIILGFGLHILGNFEGKTLSYRELTAPCLIAACSHVLSKAYDSIKIIYTEALCCAG